MSCHPSQIMTNNKEHRPWRQTTQSNRTATSVETSVNNFNRKETGGREPHPILPFHWSPLTLFLTLKYEYYHVGKTMTDQ